METVLSVNLNKIALLRNARGRDFPNVASFATKAIDCGAGGITLHPRPDQRHARNSDAFEMKELVDRYEGVELNIEGNPEPEFMDVVLKVLPHQCTLVPDSPDQVTSDHGWDLESQRDRLVPIIDRLRSAGIRVSLFMDPVPSQISLAEGLGAKRIELYTEEYAETFSSPGHDAVFEKYREAANHAHGLGLQLNAGHDLNLENLGKFLAIDGIREVSIGHAIVVESLEFGFENTIRKYMEIIRG